MATILEEITARKRHDLQAVMENVPAHELYHRVERLMEDGAPHRSLAEALRKSPTGIIAEFKRKSPSKGWIKEEGRADTIPLAYQQAGAAAVSILTDSHYFGGNDSFVLAARDSGVTLPVLYKNFVVDEYQLFQARLCGASAVLLIAADLKRSECRTLARMAHELQMEVLLEMHSEHETDYISDIDLTRDMCGINNRNLGTFVTDTQNSFRLATRLPKEACKVSESGIDSPDTVCALRLAGFHGFLIGECFMKTDKPGEALEEFVLKVKEGVLR